MYQVSFEYMECFLSDEVWLKYWDDNDHTDAVATEVITITSKNRRAKNDMQNIYNDVVSVPS